MLDPSKSTQCYTWLLFALLSKRQALVKLQTAKTDAGAAAERHRILDLIADFFYKFNPENATLAGDKFYQLASLYTEYILGY